MEAGLMEIVRSLNRSRIYDTYFSLYRAIHPGEKSGECPGEMSEYLLVMFTVQHLISPFSIFQLTTFAFAFCQQKFFTEADANADAKVSFDELFSAVLKKSGYKLKPRKRLRLG